jgi:hypothetical protein
MVSDQNSLLRQSYGIVKEAVVCENGVNFAKIDFGQVVTMKAMNPFIQSTFPPPKKPQRPH